MHTAASQSLFVIFSAGSISVLLWHENVYSSPLKIEEWRGPAVE